MMPCGKSRDAAYKGVIFGLYWGYIGIMEKKMETLGPFKGRYRVILGLYWGRGPYWGYIEIMEKKVKTTI